MFMQKFDYRKALPYIGSVLIFIILSIAYVSPVLQGKRLLQPDIVKFEGMAKEIKDFREDTGQEALWTNSMFGGMPAFQISVIYSNNISNFLHKVMTLGLPRPADMIFLYFAGFFIFLLILKLNVWVAFLGALAFAFSSYHFIIIEAGHNSKALAIAYMAPVLASIIHTFRGHYYSGGLLFAMFLALQLFSNHLQITYYLLIIVLIYGAFELAQQIKDGRLNNFLKASGVLVAAAIIAVGVNIGNFWSTYAYAQHTMRGGSELTIGDEIHDSGLSKEYITQWSYGKGETFSLLIPNVKGGATQRLGNTAAALEKVDADFRHVITQENHYWGNQPFTSGPVYVGVVVLFLFIVSLFYVKGALKWGLLLAAILSIMLAWGKNFMPLTSFFIDFIPGYNKFRAVSMILVIAELAIPALAFVGLNYIYKNPEKISYKDKAFLTALGLTAGLSLIFFIAPRVFFSFLSHSEMQAFAGMGGNEIDSVIQIDRFVQNLEAARVAIFRADAIRSFFFAIAAALLLLLFSRKIIKPALFVGILALLIVIDMWPVNRRYFDDSSFVSKRQVENPYQATRANMEILQDNEKHFRVYNVTVSSFNDASTSWFHSSIGGYHGAKLQRYQELIDYHITQGNMGVLNMLNTRWFIVPDQNRQPAASFNPDALGNAWFVREIQLVENADEEIEALYNIDPAVSATVDIRFEDKLRTEEMKYDSQARIELVEYQPNRLRYTYNSRAAQLAVFSEIYYPDGWKAFVNGEETEHFRVNYILRGMILPEGENEVEFRFEPASYNAGEKIAAVFSLLFIVVALFYVYRKVKPLLPVNKK